MNDTATTEIYPLSLPDALPISSAFITSQMTPAGSSPAMRARSTEPSVCPVRTRTPPSRALRGKMCRSEEHTFELQSRQYLVCRLLLEKKQDADRRNACTPATPF